MRRDHLEAAVRRQLTTQGAAWLEDAIVRVRGRPEAIGELFPAVGRRCGREPLGSAAGWSLDDAVRAVLLAELPLPRAGLVVEVEALYRHGDAAERRGVLRGLPLLDLGDAALPVVEDALRTNDTRLVAAALGPYGARYLPAAAWRQGVLKCVFLGIPLASVAGLDERADGELARMLADFAVERRAAGRDVPSDVWPVLNRFPAAADTAGLRLTT